MVMLILMISGLSVIVINFGAYLIVENTHVGKSRANRYIGFRLLVTNIIIFLILSIAATTMLATTRCLTLQSISRYSCELVPTEDIDVQIYYSADNNKFYTTYLAIDTIAPMKKLRELNYQERVELANHIGADYEHWSDLICATIIMSGPYCEIDPTT